VPALHDDERCGLIQACRSSGNQRRYARALSNPGDTLTSAASARGVCGYHRA
jgi:hypothetical protein